MKIHNILFYSLQALIFHFYNFRPLKLVSLAFDSAGPQISEPLVEIVFSAFVLASVPVPVPNCFQLPQTFEQTPFSSSHGWQWGPLPHPQVLPFSSQHKHPDTNIKTNILFLFSLSQHFSFFFSREWESSMRSML